MAERGSEPRGRVTSLGPVICAVDDSDGARAALKVALDLAARFGVNLVLVHAEPSTVVPGVSAALGGQERLRTMEIEDAEKLLAWLAQEEKLDAVDLRAAVGNASDIVVEAARDLQAVFVVIALARATWPAVCRPRQRFACRRDVSAVPCGDRPSRRTLVTSTPR